MSLERATPLEWYLSSTSGYARLFCELRTVDGTALIHDVRLEYRPPGDEHVRAAAVVRELTLSREKLIELVAELRSWLGQPLDVVGAQRFEHSANVAENPAESLTLELGPREDVIRGRGGVGCRIEVRSSALRSSLIFPTDPTCLGIMADGVERLGLQV